MPKQKRISNYFKVKVYFFASIYVYENICEAISCTQKCFDFCIPVCMSRDSSKRNSHIRWQFGKNSYALHEISFIDFAD